jgi:hypothetical protein
MILPFPCAIAFNRRRDGSAGNGRGPTGRRCSASGRETEEEKAVAWHSDAKSLERQGIPREFVTKSRVAIISNDWKTPT